MRSLSKVALGNVAVNLMHLLNGVVFIGLLSRLTTVAEFSQWGWVSSVVGMLAISDFYLLLFLQNLITRQFAQGRRRFADYVFRAMFWLQLLMAATLASTFLSAYLLTKCFGLNDHLVGAMTSIVLVATFAQLLSQGLGIYGAYYGGRGDSDALNLMLLIKSIIQNVILLVTLKVGFGFEWGVVFFYISGPVLLSFIFIKGEKKYDPHKFWPSKKSLTWTVFFLWRRAKLSQWAALRVLDAVRTNIPLVLGYFFVQNAELADYIVLSRLNTAMTVLAGGVFSPLVPRILTLRVTGQTRALKKKIIDFIFPAILFCFAYLVLMFFGADLITSTWAGRAVVFANSLILLVALSGLSQLMQLLMWNFMLGLDDVSALLASSVISLIALSATLYLLLSVSKIYALPVSMVIGSICFVTISFYSSYLKINKT